MAERSDTRTRIVGAAARLLDDGGPDAVTTRSVSAAAGVQPPAIYRLFGDMGGLLDAVAADGFARYLAQKEAQPPTGDPVDDLRAGWDLHQEFARGHPAHYRLMYRPDRTEATSEAVDRADEILHGLIRRIAEAGRLVTGVEHAARMVHSAGRGVAFSQIEAPPGDRDPELSERMREAVLASITTDAPDRAAGEGTPPEEDGGADREPARRAIALRAILDDAPAPLTRGERALLEELLDRIAGGAGR
ncbi:TetR/AcrR family transcriptional regulator [Nocardiopsis suaedae]|uniref:TetR/AcrR family transcriptional regulator n=1 Tax=Nocardiopsis suaedae TaxID=3018444 RepID=A0ABT4TJ35_9ACTN|nr:TetR/AcrR family transcriptional regulator [Nocardiopsis suaedae]MDA2804274.1 TetR/AcrR family transcriptional regulator [Nocardiopsis suaedae]